MDTYTSETQRWLDNRFRQASNDGFFYAHQNIYGFDARFASAYSEDGVVARYVIFWSILKQLKKLDFDSVLDVGAAEGYMAAVIRDLFGVRVRSCDLSQEACKRAKEIFNVDGDTVDGVSLPYPDGSFDVVITSESLEHIPDYPRVLNELLRIARKAVIVTVPHDGPEAIAKSLKEKTPHGHLHDFTLESFKDLVPPTYGVTAEGTRSSFLNLPFRLVEGRPLDPNTRSGFKRPLVKLMNAGMFITKLFMNQTAFKLLLAIDPFLANRFHTYRGVTYLITKDAKPLTKDLHPNVKIDAVLNFKVPLVPMAGK